MKAQLNSRRRSIDRISLLGQRIADILSWAMPNANRGMSSNSPCTRQSVIRMTIRFRPVLTLTLMVLALALLAPVAANAQVTVYHVKVQVDSVTYCDAGTAGCTVPMAWSFGSGLTLAPGQTLVLTQTGFLTPPGNPNFPNFDTSDKVGPAGATPCGSGVSCPVSIFLDLTGAGLPSTPQYGPVTANALNNNDTDSGSGVEGVDFSTVATAPSYTLSLGYADSSHPGATSVGPCPSTTTSSLCVPSTWDGTHGTNPATYFMGAALTGGGFVNCGNYCFDAGAILITGVAQPGSIALSKDPDGGTFNSGDQLSFTMVVTSNGPGTAQNVTLNDPLPTTGGLVWQVSSDTSGTCSIVSQTLNCPFGNLANGQTRTVVVVSQSPTPNAVCAAGTINNTATVTATGLPPVSDTGSYTCNACQVTATDLSFNGNTITFGVTNGNSTTVTLSKIVFNWPTVNGTLQTIKLGSAQIYGGGGFPPLNPPSATITTFAGTAAQRTLAAGASAVITIQFHSNADTNDAHYNGTFTFGNCPVTIPGGCVLGYPYSSGNPLTSLIFNESSVLQQINPLVASAGGTIQVYATDEHAPLLGVRTSTMPVSPLPSNPGHVGTGNPQPAPPVLDGDPTIADPSGRLIHPGLFITDVTGLSDNATHTDPVYRAGDWQYCSSLAPGGTGCLGVAPNDVFGTWKGAAKSGTTLVTDADPSGQNHWTLGPGSDTPTGGFSSLQSLGFGTEFRWNVNSLTVGGLPLQSGHTYRVQVIVHDGDQNKSGGDVGQACALIKLQ
jgi:uncharacterized repeat protein (TIGR01451 family)